MPSRTPSCVKQHFKLACSYRYRILEVARGRVRVTAAGGILPDHVGATVGYSTISVPALSAVRSARTAGCSAADVAVFMVIIDATKLTARICAIRNGHVGDKWGMTRVIEQTGISMETASPWWRKSKVVNDLAGGNPTRNNTSAK